jgi:aminopeptidase-like protein
MTIPEPLACQVADPAIGQQIYDLAAEIFPICRSITGDGVRLTLDRLRSHVDLTVHEVPTGTQVFDWTVPREWNLRDAYIKNEAGERVVDMGRSNLHVVSYSVPVRAWMRLDELKPHLFSLPNQPDLIPYRTSYYAENWGFCLPHRQLCGLPDGMYEVLIDADLEDGSLTYGEYLHRGETEEEVLLSAHVCHPSLANDNCSGVALLAHLAKRLDGIRTYYSYRFLFAPGTIGAIAWLARNEHRVNHVKHGLVVSCVGDAGGPVYKKSRRGDAVIDRAMAHVLHHTDSSPTILEFAPYGYDERQFCSPGFDLPVGLFQRSQFGTFPEYNTSADDLDLIGPDHLAKSYAMITAALEIIDCPWRPRNTMPRCEPQLGRRGLYAALGGDKDGPAKSMALLWILNLADGSHTLLDMAERSEMPFSTIMSATRLLESHGLVKLKSPECQSSGK